MAKYTPYFFNLAAFAGLVAAIGFVTWAKLILGCILVVTGAFFPVAGESRGNHSRGSAQIKAWGVMAKGSGAIRSGVMVAGLILVVTNAYEAHKAAEKHIESDTGARASTTMGGDNSNPTLLDDEPR
jgi:hypothetical protein